MSIQSIPNRQLCPSCFDWSNRAADDNYRYVLSKKDNPSGLRGKFAKIFFGALLGIPLLRLPSRCILLCTGSWALAGHEKAEKIWMQQCVQCHRLNQTPPKPLSYYRIAAVCIVSELVKDIAKCATLPLAMIGLIFAAFWGMANPHDVRKLIGMIEDLWSIELPKWAMNAPMAEIVNWMAFCMQNVESFKRKNLFRYVADYNPHTLRSLLLSLEILHKEGLAHVENFEERTLSWKGWVKRYSPSNSQETDQVGNLNLTGKKLELKDALLTLLAVSNALNNRIVAAAPNEELIGPAWQLAIDDAAAAVDLLLKAHS